MAQGDITKENEHQLKVQKMDNLKRFSNSIIKISEHYILSLYVLVTNVVGVFFN